MTVLVIGRSGQLARALMQTAAETDVPIHCVGRPDVDVLNRNSIKAAFEVYGPTAVINAAAYTAVDQAEREREQAFAINAQGAENVAVVCEQTQTPLVHISTDYVFDGTKNTPYVETDEPNPLGVYGASKREGERRVIDACPQHIIVRTAWVYSPFQTNFVKTMFRLAGEREEISVVDDQVGSPTSARDLATALTQICTAISDQGSQSAWGIFHAAGSGAASWCTFAREVFRVSQSLGGPSARVKPISSQAYLTAAVRPNNSRLNCGKLKETYGIEMADWRCGVAQCVKQLASSETQADTMRT